MALIYVDAWGIKNGPHGISRYCRGLIPPLVAAGARHRFVILRPHRTDADDRLDPSGSAREIEIAMPPTDWAALAFRPILEPVFRRHGRPDVYHSLFQMLPLALRRGARGPRRTIVTLHDLICLDTPAETQRSRIGGAWAKRFDHFVIPYALRHADHVICVSDATRRRATEFVPLDRSTTVHHGVDPHWFDRASAVEWEQRRPYVAALGTPRPYKNVACIAGAVMKAAETIPALKLVLVGGDGALDDGAKRALGDRLIVTGRVDDPELHAIVQSALLFVVASRAEGFGLPLLEAMAIGTPVAASDIPALREVGGGAALWFSPDNPDELAGMIERVAADARLRADTIERGRARAAAFTWPAAAAATIDVYEQALAREGSA